MLRGTVRTRSGWLAALIVAWGLLPAPVRAQNSAAPPPAASFGPVPGGVSGCASCGAQVGTSRGTKCCEICCPKFHHCYEGPVRMCFHHACAKPVCNPCDVPHFGHWQKCWTPWPYGPDWSHCVAQPPAAQVVLNPLTHYLPPPAATPTPGINQRLPGSDEETPLPRPTLPAVLLAPTDFVTYA